MASSIAVNFADSSMGAKKLAGYLETHKRFFPRLIAPVVSVTESACPNQACSS
jgi:hypothetical protein